MPKGRGQAGNHADLRQLVRHGAMAAKPCPATSRDGAHSTRDAGETTAACRHISHYLRRRPSSRRRGRPGSGDHLGGKVGRFSLLGNVNGGRGCSGVDGASQAQARGLTSHVERLRPARNAVVMPAVGTAVAAAGANDEADPSELLAELRALGRGGMATTDRRAFHGRKGSCRPPLQHGHRIAHCEVRCASARPQVRTASFRIAPTSARPNARQRGK